MTRPKSPIFALSAVSSALLIALGFAAPNSAFAGAESGELEVSLIVLSFGNVTVGTTIASQGHSALTPVRRW